MHIHEYQGKALLSEFYIPIAYGKVVFTKSEALDALSSFDLKRGVVVKAQIHAGGRGKAGGVKLVKDEESFRLAVDSLLGKALITSQTKPEGQLVHALYLEEACDIAKEYYLSMAIDRQNKRILVIASIEGGMDIEEVAEKHKDKILYIGIDPVMGYQGFHGRKLASFLKIPKAISLELASILKGMYEAFIHFDAELIEINPLVLTKDGRLLALDAKMSFDDNGLGRQERARGLVDENEMDPAELKAKKHDLNYVKLDGNIGCMVNGAGLAMATMDIIMHHGGVPANFLDVGGGASKDKVTEAFKIIMDDRNVRAVFVNIFGGIMRCDVIAEGIINAATELHLSVPLVVRLQGTNVNEGRHLLSKSGLHIIAEDDFDTAAHTAVNIARGH